MCIDPSEMGVSGIFLKIPAPCSGYIDVDSLCDSDVSGFLGPNYSYHPTQYTNKYSRTHSDISEDFIAVIQCDMCGKKIWRKYGELENFNYCDQCIK